MSSPRPLVSILINNYNYGRFLREAIDSALRQTYTNTEVIVVDDGSTDDSRQIIAAYGSRIVPVLKQNAGQASAFNAGFAVSKGELVCLLDSDDVWITEKVERVVQAALSRPTAVLIYHRVQPVSVDLRPIRRVIPMGVFCGNIAAKVKKSGGWWACSPTSGLCFPRAALQRIGQIPEKGFRTCADAFLFYLLPLVGDVLGITECLAFYRLHGTNNYNNPTAQNKPQDAASLLSGLEQYERFVASVNQRLELLQTGATLSLEDHWQYQFIRYIGKEEGCIPFAKFAWRTLRFPGEPAVLNRFRMVAGLVMCSLSRSSHGRLFKAGSNA